MHADRTFLKSDDNSLKSEIIYIYNRRVFFGNFAQWQLSIQTSEKLNCCKDFIRKYIGKNNFK